MSADYAFEGEWSPCTEAALWHFNLHPEHLFDVHARDPEGGAAGWRSAAFDVDGAAATVGFDADEDVDALAGAVARDHGLLGAGCAAGDSGCVATALALELRAARVADAAGHRCPVARFCCG